MNVTLKL